MTTRKAAKNIIGTLSLLGVMWIGWKVYGEYKKRENQRVIIPIGEEYKAEKIGCLDSCDLYQLYDNKMNKVQVIIIPPKKRNP